MQSSLGQYNEGFKTIQLSPGKTPDWKNRILKKRIDMSITDGTKDLKKRKYFPWIFSNAWIYRKIRKGEIKKEKERK